MVRLQVRRRSKWNGQLSNNDSFQYVNSKRPSWNSYLTDGERFKLTKSQILLRKKVLYSPSTFLAASSISGTKIKRENENVQKVVHEIRPIFKYYKSNCDSNRFTRTIKPKGISPTDSDFGALDLIQSKIANKGVNSSPLRTGYREEISNLKRTPPASKYSERIPLYEEDMNNYREILISINSLNQELVAYESLTGKPSSIAKFKV